MCGIVGYVGAEQAAPILLEGLSRLEWTVKGGKRLDLQGSASPKPGRVVSFIVHPGKRASNRPQNTL